MRAYNRADRFKTVLLHNPQSPHICMSDDPRSSKHYISCQFEKKNKKTQLDHRSTCILISITTCWPLFVGLSANNFKKAILLLFSSVTSSLNICRTWLQTHARKALYMVVDTRHILHSKTSFHFPNFDASSAWQVGHSSQEGFFPLGKNCSWTLLPGWTKLITSLQGRI